jgi:hypothetical protein
VHLPVGLGRVSNPASFFQGGILKNSGQENSNFLAVFFVRKRVVTRLFLPNSGGNRR